MRAILILFFLMSIGTDCLGQGDYGSWVTNSCYKYIQTRVKVDGKGALSKCGERETSYTVQIKNTSSERIRISYNLFTHDNYHKYICDKGQIKFVNVKGDRVGESGWTEIDPGGTLAVPGSFLRGGNKLFVEILSVRFIRNGKVTNYQKCDDGHPCPECVYRPHQVTCRDENTNESDDDTQSGQQRFQQEKIDRYNNLMTQGSDALNGGNYSAAMNYYSQAKTAALTDEQRNYAEQMYQQAFEAKKTAERTERVANQKKADDAENIAYGAGVANTITLMSLIEDSPSIGFTSGKIFLGLNMERIPLISNNASIYHANKSYIEAPLIPGFDFGLSLGIANNKPVSLYLNPKFSYGLHALSEGTSGHTMEYGGTALLRLSFKRDWDEAGFKPYLEGGYFKRSGSFHYDGDATAGGSSATDDVRDGEFKYTVIRYGGGLMIHGKDEDEEYMVRAGAFFDKPSFFPKDIKPVLGFSLQGMYHYIGTLEVYYSPKYFIGGTVLYPTTLEKENKSYFGIKFTRSGKLW